MSLARLKFKIKRSHGGQLFTKSNESIIEASEDAADMPILYDRMLRGETPATRVLSYTSMISNSTEDMLNNPPKKIVDPTDVPRKELTKMVMVDDSVEQNKTE